MLTSLIHFIVDNFERIISVIAIIASYYIGNSVARRNDKRKEFNEGADEMRPLLRKAMREIEEKNIINALSNYQSISTECFERFYDRIYKDSDRRLVKQAWDAYREAEKANITLHPNQFNKMVVDRDAMLYSLATLLSHCQRK